MRLWRELHGLTQNYFEIFSLPVAYTIDMNSLNQHYRLIQKSVHPDRFITGTDAEKQQSLIKSTQVNDAYQTLKDSVKRASYLIRLHYDKEESGLPPEFLMQQMEWEEELEDANEEQSLQLLSDKIEADKKIIENVLVVTLDEKKDWESALSHLSKLKFLTKLAGKIQQKTFALDVS